MLHCKRVFVAGFAIGALFSAPSAALPGEAVIELNVGGAPSIAIQFDGSVLSTASPQGTPVHFVNGLNWLADPPGGFFTLEGVTVSAPATVMGTLVGQQFTGGSFSLYLPDSTLLLSGDLSPSGLVGTIGQPNGILFTTSFGMVTGGTLAAELIDSSLVLQMHLFNVNGLAGLSAPVGGQLGSFTADVTVDIEADLVPEPATLLLFAVAAGAYSARRPRRRG